LNFNNLYSLIDPTADGIYSYFISGSLGSGTTYTVNIGNIQVNNLPIYAQLASSKITTWNCYRLVPATGLALTSSLTASKNSICAFTGISLLSAA